MPFTHRSARPNGASLRALRDPDAASSRSRPPVPRMAVRIGEIRRSKAVRPQRCIYMLYALQDVAMAAGVFLHHRDAAHALRRDADSLRAFLPDWRAKASRPRRRTRPPASW